MADEAPLEEAAALVAERKITTGEFHDAHESLLLQTIATDDTHILYTSMGSCVLLLASDGHKPQLRSEVPLRGVPVTELAPLALCHVQRAAPCPARPLPFAWMNLSCVSCESHTIRAFAPLHWRSLTAARDSRAAFWRAPLWSWSAISVGRSLLRPPSVFDRYLLCKRLDLEWSIRSLFAFAFRPPFAATFRWLCSPTQA